MAAVAPAPPLLSSSALSSATNGAGHMARKRDWASASYGRTSAGGDGAPAVFTTTRCECAHWSQGPHVRRSAPSVGGWPMTTRPRLARVKLTFTRRQSVTKPMLPYRLARTAENTMTSFSRP